MKKWKSHTFSSGTVIGDDFKSFSKDFKRNLNIQLRGQARVVNYTVGHYYVSGFAEKDGKYVYFSLFDVRFFNDWHSRVLYRTATGPKDYTGGMNRFTSLDRLGADILSVL